MSCAAALLASAVLLATPPADSATFQWDASSGTVDGYWVYFQDVAVPEKVFSYKVMGGALEVLDIEQTLHLTPGAAYLFWVTAFNITGESPHDQSPVVEWTYEWTPYLPPEDVLPEPYDWVLLPTAPGGARILKGTK